MPLGPANRSLDSWLWHFCTRLGARAVFGDRWVRFTTLLSSYVLKLRIQNLHRSITITTQLWNRKAGQGHTTTLINWMPHELWHTVTLCVSTTQRFINRALYDFQLIYKGPIHRARRWSCFGGVKNISSISSKNTWMWLCYVPSIFGDGSFCIFRMIALEYLS